MRRMTHYGIWCEACNAALPYLNAPHCQVCSLPTPQGELCGHCLKKTPLFTRTIAAFGYQFPIDQLIRAMKYHEMITLSQIFAEKLMQRIDKSNLPDYIIPMPLHPAKLRRVASIRRS